MLLWPLVLMLGYTLAPLFGLGLWIQRLWQLRSGWLRALATGCFIVILVSSLNTQVIPSYNGYWMLVLALALLLPHFLPDAPQSRAYHLASHSVLLLMSLGLHLWYVYLYQRPLFDNSFSYYALPALSLCIAPALLLLPRQKTGWRKLALLLIAVVAGLAIGQFFYLTA